MILNCEQSALVNATSVILKGISNRSSLPILSGMKIKIKDNVMTLISTDLEISLMHKITVDCQEEGEGIFPARLFFDIIRNLPESIVQIKTIDGQKAEIECGTIKYDINLLNVDDWPDINMESAATDITILYNLFERAVGKVTKAASRDETRRVLTGILVSVKDDEMNMVATDSYRLAISRQGINKKVKKEVNVIIPGRVLDEVVKIASFLGCGEVMLKFDENQVFFKCNETLIKTRLIEGQYPDYEKLIPEESMIQIPLERDIFKNAVKRMSIISKANSPLLFNIIKDEIEISSQSSGIGQACEKISLSYDGQEEKIAFNGQYLLEGINSGEENIVLEIIDGQKPGIIKNKDNDDYLYLIMPVRV